MNGSRQGQFYQPRMQATDVSHHMKQNNSNVNDLSAYSRKARVRGICEVPVIYTYDIERMEPLWAKVFPGSSIDAHVVYRKKQIKVGPCLYAF